MRLTLPLLLMLVSVCSFGQDWQSSYNKAVASYQAGDFTKAITEAESALKSAADEKSKAFTLQIITASALDGGDFAKGLSLVTDEISKFSSLEPNGKNHVEAIQKHGNLLMAAGKPQEAAEVFKSLADIQQKVSGPDSYPYFYAVSLQADAFLAIGDFNQAKTLYNIAVPGFKGDAEAGEDYLYSLYNLAFSQHQLKEFDFAKENLAKFLSIADQNSLTDIEEYKDAQKMLSAINSASGESGGFLVAEDQSRIAFQKAMALQNSDPAEAKKQFVLAEKAVEEGKVVNNTSFSIYLNFGRFLFSHEAYSDGLARVQKAKAQATQLFSKTSPEMGHVLVLEGDLALHDKKPETMKLYMQALSNLKSEKPEVLSGQVRWIAEELLMQNWDKEAIELTNVILKDPVSESFPIHDQVVLHRLNATAYLGVRDFSTLMQQVNGRLASATNPDLKQNFLLILALTSRESGDWKATAAYLDQASKTTGSMVRGEVYYEHARLYQQLGNFKDAEVAYQKAIEHLDESFSPSTLRPQVYNSFATFYIQLGNLEGAEQLLKTLLAKKADHSSFYNSVRQNLAAIYQQMHRFNEAKTLLITTIESDRELLGVDHPDYAIGIQNLASLYKEIGQVDSALLLYREALAIDKKHYGEVSLAYATKLANVGTVLQDMENYEEARKVLEQSLAIRKKLLSSDHPDYAYNLYNLAYLLYRTNKNLEALPYFKEASAAYIKQIKDVFPVLSDHERSAFYNKIQEVIRGYENFLVENVHVIPNLSGELLNFRLETKALLLSASMKARNQILSSNNQDLIGKFATWQHTREQLAYLYSLSLEEQELNKALIDEYTRKSLALEKELSIASQEFAANFVHAPADWHSIQKNLNEGEAAIEFVRFQLPVRDSIIYAALIVKPGATNPDVAIFPEGRQMENRFFRRYINGIRYFDDDDDSYNNYWLPIDKHLGGVKVLYISPDGVYNKINCNTLVNPENLKFVVENYEINLVTNLKDVVRPTSASQASSTEAVLFGFPDYRLNSTVKIAKGSSTRSSNPFYQVVESGVTDLPGTANEVEKIKQTLSSAAWNVKLHMREQALEESLKSIKNPGILHIATHGFFIPPDQTKTNHVFTNDLNQVQHNVMLRSGLLLTGAEKNLIEKLNGTARTASDDGVLTAYEVMNLTLDHTDLVVLSACETGAGDVRNGEGVYGLQRAFMVAGANNLLMSLWKVDDTATQEMMSSFYKTLAAEKDKGKSFYQTQLEMKEKFKYPYYWGAFVMVGK